MAEISYKINLKSILPSPSFTEASGEELRVLLALIALDGRAASKEQLARAASVSESRAASALALFEDAGLIEDTPSGVSYEFREREGDFNPAETDTATVAKDIRDNALASLITECTRLMKSASLVHSDVAAISSLYTQLALSPEYILTLAAHLADKGRLTARRLVSKAEELVRRDIDTLEALEIYVAERERETAAEWEIRRVLGIKGRATTPSERKAFNRWSEELGFGPEIIRAAFDIAVKNTQGLSVPYMDAVLGAWHAAGCKTLKDCERAASDFKSAAPQPSKPAAKRGAAKTADEPKYSDFNSDDALMQALLRSYGDDDKKEGQG